MTQENQAEDLTSAQLLYLTELFGDNVFNIGTVNSNLVVDHKKPSVKISITAKAGVLNIQNDNIFVNEPGTAKLVANHFTLTANTAENIIAQNVSDLERLTNNNYLWTFVNDPSSPDGAAGSSYKYSKLRVASDGQVRLDVEESDGVAYTMHVRVYFINDGCRVYDNLTLTTIPVTFPSKYEFYTYGDTVREFKYTKNIINDLFGTGSISVAQTLPQIFVIGKSNTKTEFALKPFPAK